MADTIEVLGERMRQMEQRLAATDRHVERLDETLGRLAPVPVILEQVQRDVRDLRTSTTEALKRQEERDKAAEELRETRGSNLRASTLTLLSLFLSVLLAVVSAAISIGLKLAGR